MKEIKELTKEAKANIKNLNCEELRELCLNLIDISEKLIISNEQMSNELYQAHCQIDELDEELEKQTIKYNAITRHAEALVNHCEGIKEELKKLI